MRLLILLFAMPFMLQAQTFRVSDEIEMEVLGTSTLHDWEMVSKEGSGTANFTIENGELKDISSLKFTLKTKTLKSGKSAMDKISYESMKAEDNPTISFKLDDMNSVRKVGDTYKISAKGMLTIAGKTNPATIIVTGIIKNGAVQFTGEYDLKMTQFDIEPPTAMFGTIKTGDDIKVKWTVSYSSTSSF